MQPKNSNHQFYKDLNIAKNPIYVKRKSNYLNICIIPYFLYHMRSKLHRKLIVMIFLNQKINCYRCEIFYGSIKTAQRSKQSVCSCVIPSRRSTSIFYAFSCFLLRDDMCMNSFSLVFQLGAKWKRHIFVFLINEINKLVLIENH